MRYANVNVSANSDFDKICVYYAGSHYSYRGYSFNRESSMHIVIKIIIIKENDSVVVF